jgi:hypothetical protein
MGLVRYALDSATLVARESSYQQEHKDQHIFAVVQGLELKVEERLFWSMPYRTAEHIGWAWSWAQTW